MNINFEYYRIFYYVAKYSNFTKAAHALGNSQPNITPAEFIYEVTTIHRKSLLQFLLQTKQTQPT